MCLPHFLEKKCHPPAIFEGWHRICVFNCCSTLIAVAEDAEQVEEQVDEVEVKCQSTDSGKFAHIALACFHCHLLNLLHVPCGETDKDYHTCCTDTPSQSRTCKEDVHHRHDEGGFGADNQQGVKGQCKGQRFCQEPGKLRERTMKPSSQEFVQHVDRQLIMML